MKSTRTADSRNASGTRIESATDPAVTRSSSTHAKADVEASPRLPHEQDESSDSGTRGPDPVMIQAAKDLESGIETTDRGEATDRLYQQTLRGDDSGASGSSPVHADGASGSRADAARSEEEISTSTEQPNPATSREHAIRDIAHRRFQARGAGEGSELQDWLDAEAEFDAATNR